MRPVLDTVVACCDGTCCRKCGVAIRDDCIQYRDLLRDCCCTPETRDQCNNVATECGDVCHECSEACCACGACLGYTFCLVTCPPGKPSPLLLTYTLVANAILAAYYGWTIYKTFKCKCLGVEHAFFTVVMFYHFFFFGFGFHMYRRFSQPYLEEDPRKRTPVYRCFTIAMEDGWVTVLILLLIANIGLLQYADHFADAAKCIHCDGHEFIDAQMRRAPIIIYLYVAGAFGIGLISLLIASVRHAQEGGPPAPDAPRRRFGHFFGRRRHDAEQLPLMADGQTPTRDVHVDVGAAKGKEPPMYVPPVFDPHGTTPVGPMVPPKPESPFEVPSQSPRGGVGGSKSPSPFAPMKYFSFRNNPFETPSAEVAPSTSSSQSSMVAADDAPLISEPPIESLYESEFSQATLGKMFKDA